MSNPPCRWDAAAWQPPARDSAPLNPDEPFNDALAAKWCAPHCASQPLGRAVRCGAVRGTTRRAWHAEPRLAPKDELAGGSERCPRAAARACRYALAAGFGGEAESTYRIGCMCAAPRRRRRSR